MAWLKVILELVANGLEWFKNNQLLQAGQAQARKEDSDASVKAMEARDSVNDDNADKFLLPPDKR